MCDLMALLFIIACIINPWILALVLVLLTLTGLTMHITNAVTEYKGRKQ